MLHLLALLGLVAAGAAPVLVAPSAASAQGSSGVTVRARVDVEPRPDHVRVGWRDKDNVPEEFSVRDNDEITFQRCVTRGSADEECEEFTATCGAVVEDMEDLYEMLDRLSVELKKSWDDQSTSNTNLPSGYRHLPGYDNTAGIGLAELLRAAWPLLPLRYMFLNWDMAFISGVDLDNAAAVATTLKGRIGDADNYAAIVRDHGTTATWRIRTADAAGAHIDTTDDGVNPTDVAGWVTDRNAGAYRFPVLTLGALLDPGSLARQVNPQQLPDTSTEFGAELGRLTGGKAFGTWTGDLQAMTGEQVKEALGFRLSAEQRAKLDGADAHTVIDGLKDEFPIVTGLHSALSNDPRSAGVPYTVRAVLAYLKIIAEHPGDILSGFDGGRSYKTYEFPFQVLFEAPDLVAGLLDLFGLARPRYRSVRDVRFGHTPATTYYEERAESLLLEMHDVCVDDLVISDDRFLRLGNPYSTGTPDSGPLGAVSRAMEEPLAGGSGFSLPRGGEGSLVGLTGAKLGETTAWYCYSLGNPGCTTPWTPITVLVEPAGWNDARVVIQRDHFHVVVDWKSGNVIVLRPSVNGTLPLTKSPPHPADWDGYGISSKGRWVHDAHVRRYMPPTPGQGYRYEIVSHYCCLRDPTDDWSFEVELPVMDNDEVHFYRKADPDKPAGPGNELKLLEGVATCDSSRYCEQLRVHELANRRKLTSGGSVDVTAGAGPTTVTARINARLDAQGRTVPLFAGGGKRFYDKFWLSYCVSAVNVGCRNWTDRRLLKSGTTSQPHLLIRGHCVVATSLDLPVAPNAPSELSIREWARRTGRPQGEFYFVRNLAAVRNPRVPNITAADLEDLGWNHGAIVSRGYTFRNYECPALDPQNPTLREDWDSDEPGYVNCTGDSNEDGRRSHGQANNRTPILDTTPYAGADTLEYRAYRRFWTCLQQNSPVVGRFVHGHGNDRAGHPTEFNVLVTLEFIDPETGVGRNYIDKLNAPSDEQTTGDDANCATDNGDKEAWGPTVWDTTWNVAPAVGERSHPEDWCHPPVACWTDSGEPLWDELTSPAHAAEAGCPHGEPVSRPPDLRACWIFYQVLLYPPYDDYYSGDCDSSKPPVAPAARFALREGCIRPFAGGTPPPPGHGVLRSGHYRWVDVNHYGSPGGTDSTPSNDPGPPFFPVGAGLAVDPTRVFCQGATMRIVGVWPTYPGHTLPGRTLWPSGACDGRTPDDGNSPPDTNPTYEIDEVCARSYPRLYDKNKDPLDGIQLSDRWKRCLNAPPGVIDTSKPDQRCTETVPGCVGEGECRNWVIPQSGFYQVRIEVDSPRVAKTGSARIIAGLTDDLWQFAGGVDKPEDFADDAKGVLGETSWGAVRQVDSTLSVTDPDPFVFDTLIWAQTLFSGPG